MNTPKEIAQNYVALGVTKTKYSTSKLLLLGIMAGMFVGLASVGATMAQATVAGTAFAPVGKLLSAVIFSSALAMVLIAGSELFTGNCLIIIAVLEKEVKVKAMLRNLALVYVGNFIGGLLVAVIAVYSGVFSAFGNAAAVTAIYTAVTKASLPFFDALLRGIFCNVLVCIAVWMAFAAKDVGGKVLALILPITLFVLSGYEHCIANMCYLPTGWLAVRNYTYYNAYAGSYELATVASLTWKSMFLNNLIPSTIGNIIGGSGLVGTMYWLIYLREPKITGKKASKKR